MSLEQHNDVLCGISCRDGFQRLARKLQEEIGSQMSADNNFSSFGYRRFIIGRFMDQAKRINVKLGLDSDD